LVARKRMNKGITRGKKAKQRIAKKPPFNEFGRRGCPQPTTGLVGNRVQHTNKGRGRWKQRGRPRNKSPTV